MSVNRWVDSHIVTLYHIHTTEYYSDIEMKEVLILQRERTSTTMKIKFPLIIWAKIQKHDNASCYGNCAPEVGSGANWYNICGIESGNIYQTALWLYPFNQQLHFQKLTLMLHLRLYRKCARGGSLQQKLEKHINAHGWQIGCATEVRAGGGAECSRKEGEVKMLVKWKQPSANEHICARKRGN